MHLLQLGKDNLVNVFVELTPQDIRSFGLCCKALLEISRHDILWHRYTNAYFKSSFEFLSLNPKREKLNKRIRELQLQKEKGANSALLEATLSLLERERSSLYSWHSYLMHKIRKRKQTHLVVSNGLLQLSPSGLTCTYTGTKDRTLPVYGSEWLTEGIHYWTVTVNSSNLTGQVYIYIGVVSAFDVFAAFNLGMKSMVRKTAPLGSLISEWSLSPHSDVVKNAISKPYKHNNGIKSGDTIGVWVNMDTRTLAFYQNGEYCGVAFTNLPEMVIPCVTMMAPGESITVNFDPPIPKISPVSSQWKNPYAFGR